MQMAPAEVTKALLKARVIVRGKSGRDGGRFNQGISAPGGVYRAVCLGVIEAGDWRLGEQEIGRLTSAAEPGIDGYASLRVFIHWQRASIHHGMSILPGWKIEERPVCSRVQGLGA